MTFLSLGPSSAANSRSIGTHAPVDLACTLLLFWKVQVELYNRSNAHLKILLLTAKLSYTLICKEVHVFIIRVRKGLVQVGKLEVLGAKALIQGSLNPLPC